MIEQSSYDKERLVHINNLMDTIHTSSNDIYECLVDRDFDKLKDSLDSLQIILKDISLSIEDDL
jgi:hypothetical protein